MAGSNRDICGVVAGHENGSVLFPQLKQAIEQIHSYEVPEVIAVPITEGSEKYLSWLGRQIDHS